MCKSGSVHSSNMVASLTLELSSLRELSGQGEKYNYRKQFRTTWCKLEGNGGGEIIRRADEWTSVERVNEECV